MADGFAADVQEIQKYSEHWNEQAQQVGKLPAQISTIESKLGSVLEHTTAVDALNFVVGGVQVDKWFDLRSKLQDVSAKLETTAKQLAADSETLRRCSIEYQLADQAAADGFDSAELFFELQSGSSPTWTLLHSLAPPVVNGVQLPAPEIQDAIDTAGGLIGDSPGSVSKTITDTGPDFVPWAHEEVSDPKAFFAKENPPEPPPVKDPTVLS
jgi:hypothetical protein